MLSFAWILHHFDWRSLLFKIGFYPLLSIFFWNHTTDTFWHQELFQIIPFCYICTNWLSKSDDTKNSNFFTFSLCWRNWTKVWCVLMWIVNWLISSSFIIYHKSVSTFMSAQTKWICMLLHGDTIRFAENIVS